MWIDKPRQIWVGHPVFIIGGGDSLRSFDWGLLHHRRCIGCNDAYKLGEQVTDVLVFGDLGWFKHHKERLRKFKNPIWTSCEGVPQTDWTWLNVMQRGVRGLYNDALGWNGHTGSNAINLALLFGASVIYLLGFDMGYVAPGKTEKDTNWHDEVIHPNAVLPSSYQRFRERTHHIVRDWKTKWPEVQIYNVTPGSSLTKAIPRIDFDEFWSLQKEKKGVS
jgi:hypothetical protein